MNVLVAFLEHNGLDYLSMGTLLALYQASKSLKGLFRDRVIQVWSMVLADGEKQFRHWFKKIFYPETKPYINPEVQDTIDFQLQFTKNLLRNGSAKQKLDYWKIVKSGGDGWGIESYETCSKYLKKYSFVGSYEEGEISQSLELSIFKNALKSMNYKCTFQAGVYIAREPKYDAIARVTFNIIGMNDCSIYEEGIEVGEEITSQYRMLIFKVKDELLVKNVKQVKLSLVTKSVDKIKGFHSARFTNAFFRIIP